MLFSTISQTIVRGGCPRIVGIFKTLSLGSETLHNALKNKDSTHRKVGYPPFFRWASCSRVLKHLNMTFWVFMEIFESDFADIYVLYKFCSCQLEDEQTCSRMRRRRVCTHIGVISTHDNNKL